MEYSRLWKTEVAADRKQAVTSWCCDVSGLLPAEHVYIPRNVKEVGRFCFKACIGLRSVVICPRAHPVCIDKAVFAGVWLKSLNMAYAHLRMFLNGGDQRWMLLWALGAFEERIWTGSEKPRTPGSGTSAAMQTEGAWNWQDSDWNLQPGNFQSFAQAVFHPQSFVLQRREQTFREIFTILMYGRRYAGTRKTVGCLPAEIWIHVFRMLE